ncbi:hypothetical protein HQQ88_08255 [Curtobacterium sp. VKM Ac-2861]|uniref:hypothetical protein n=1 Tax=Curtobacterium sp. VKM Ac-2861 TaxID=2739016 RepID=UPI001567912E|nr:hypothetical protein [Curtobacterium sp. VKM Ac-2861]
MKLTTPDSLPYPEDGDDFAPLEQWFKDLAVATQAALADDSGWITPELTAGHVAQSGWGFRVRRNQVQWRGAVAKTNSTEQFAAGYTRVTNDLPVIGQSKQYYRGTVALFNGYTANVVISSNRMDVGISGTSANAVYFGSVSYPND